MFPCQAVAGTVASHSLIELAGKLHEKASSWTLLS